MTARTDRSAAQSPVAAEPARGDASRPEDGTAIAEVAKGLACPACRGALTLGPVGASCGGCGEAYRREGTLLDLRPAAQHERTVEDWSEHWHDGKQTSAVQRFFSTYRKSVFARTVRHFTGKHFAGSGVFLEAGSGTSETSFRIDRRGGERVLVALDLIPGVLRRCHPVMDVRVAGDAFALPFRDGFVDGLWNVGVMEHFEHHDIDRMLAEFHRVLRPGGVIVLLWPGRDSIPQRMLEAVAFVVNAVKRPAVPFRFHPPEISRLKSARAGAEILRRNGFETLELDRGLRSLFAFKVLVGSKPR